MVDSCQRHPGMQLGIELHSGLASEMKLVSSTLFQIEAALTNATCSMTVSYLETAPVHVAAGALKMKLLLRYFETCQFQMQKMHWETALWMES